MAIKKKKAVPKKKAAAKKKTGKKISVEELFDIMNDRFDIIDNKIDSLLLKSTATTVRVPAPEKDPGIKTRAFNPKSFTSEKRMHKVVCADCNVTCEVPFVPRSDRPVYCKSCYSKRRNPHGQQQQQPVQPREISQEAINKAFEETMNIKLAKLKKTTKKKAVKKAVKKTPAKKKKAVKKAVKKAPSKKKKAVKRK